MLILAFIIFLSSSWLFLALFDVSLCSIIQYCLILLDITYNNSVLLHITVLFNLVLLTINSVN